MSLTTKMNIVFTDKPPLHWNELCHNHGDLFNTPEWQGVLAKGLGSETLYGWDETASIGITITIFKAGPFRIGYLGFPVGGMVAGATISPAMIEALKKTGFPVTIHCLRIPVSAFDLGVNLPIPKKTALETSIGNLQEWKLKSAKTRCKINKARRFSIRIIAADNPLLGSKLFEIYRDTVVRHKGKMRYNVKYFEELIKLSIKNMDIRCYLAMKDDEVIGFQVVACHSRTAYSLHGCIDHGFRDYCPADLLLLEAINWAKQQGMECYNLMASPQEQLSLVHYKEKWGGVTRIQQTYDLALYPFQTMMFNFSEKVYEKIRFK